MTPWPQARMRAANELLSVVLPAYNEEKNIRAMYGAVRSALSEEAIEFVFVDDGSSDGTADAVRGLREEGAPVRLVRFGRNFGHQAALFAGLERAHGSAIIMMDCDLQHPPDLLPCMTRAWRGGAKVVQMVRLKTEDAHLFKRVSSRLFYAVLNFLSEVPVQAAAADFQLLDRQVVDAVLQFKDRKPFVRGLISWLGFPVTRIEYTASARHAGVSGYSLRKMLRLSVQAITGLSSKPLQISFYMGLLSSAFCLAYALFAVIGYFKGLTIPGWTSVIIVVTFLGAVQLLSVGILGEYIARIYEQSRAVPRCVVVEADESIPECSSSFAAPYAPEFGNFAD